MGVTRDEPGQRAETEATVQRWSPPLVAPAARRDQEAGRERRRTAERSLAVVFAVAFVTCPAIEPMPNGPDSEPALWVLPIDVAVLVAIVAAVGALWRGSARAQVLGIAAGIGMAVETVICPGTGHHLVGWYTWVQAGLSLFVLFTSAALPRLGLGQRRPPRASQPRVPRRG